MSESDPVSLNNVNGEFRADRPVRVAEQPSRSTTEGISGRSFVIIAVLTIGTLWGSLYLAFLVWRSGVNDRIEFGKAEVAAPVLRFREAEPPGISVEDWTEAVEESEVMLIELVGTGQLDLDATESFGRMIRERADEAVRNPDHALQLLQTIWDDASELKQLRPDRQRPKIFDRRELDPRADSH